MVLGVDVESHWAELQTALTAVRWVDRCTIDLL